MSEAEGLLSNETNAVGQPKTCKPADRYSSFNSIGVGIFIAATVNGEVRSSSKR
jgi:hypothetical protein